MSKGLEALHHPRIELAKIDISAEGKHDIAYMPFYKTKQYAAIEEELKDYEWVKEHANKYEADTLDEIMRLIHNGWVYERKENKQGQALEIIKEKGIILQFIKETYTVEQYNAGVSGTLVKPLTQEEYELLKEVLL